MLDEPAAEDGTECHSHGGKAGPGADGAAAIFFGERCADEGEAAGSEKRGSDSLKGAGDDELMDRLRESACSGGEGEYGDTCHEDTTAAEEVSGGASDEDECAEEQAVGLNDPLHVDDGGFKAGLECGQGDIDDRAVDECHAAAEDGSGEDPGAGLGSAGSVGGGRVDRGFVARGAHEGYGCGRQAEGSGNVEFECAAVSTL